jgi:hypothetical protein
VAEIRVYTFIKNFPQAGMVAHACIPRVQEAEAGEQQVQGQPGTHRETLPQKTTKRKLKKQNKTKTKHFLPKHRKQK